MGNRWYHPDEQTPGVPESDTADGHPGSTTPGSPGGTLDRDHSSWATRTDNRAPNLVITTQKWNPHTSSKMQIHSSRRRIEQLEARMEKLKKEDFWYFVLTHHSRFSSTQVFRGYKSFNDGRKTIEDDHYSERITTSKTDESVTRSALARRKRLIAHETFIVLLRDTLISAAFASTTDNFATLTISNDLVNSTQLSPVFIRPLSAVRKSGSWLAESKERESPFAIKRRGEKV
ncbi:hypothetical protein Trydic_g6855 [Trypoxylus dichotomus]